MSDVRRRTANAALRAHRTERGWSQDRLARELRRLAQRQGVQVPDVGVLKPEISRWERGYKDPGDLYRPLFRRLFGASDRALGFREPRDEGGTTEHLLVITGDSAATLTAALARARRIDDEVIGQLQSMVDGYRRLDRRFGSTTTIAGLSSLLTQASELADHSVKSADQRRIALVAADAATLLGWLALDRDQPREAWSYFRRGEQAARESGDTGLQAFALGESAYVQIRLRRHRDAIALLDRATGQLQGHRVPRMRAWLYAARAEAAAAAGAISDSRQALDDARHALEADDGDDEPAPYVAYLDDAHLARWVGSTLSLAGQPDASEILTQALAVADPTFVRARAGLLVDLATAQAADGSLDAACATAAQATQLAIETASVRQLRRLRRLRQALRGAATSDAYAQLIDQLGPEA